MHFDHIENRDLLDGSRLPYQENVNATREVAAWAHNRNMLLDAELGEVGGKDGAHAAGARTDPAEAEQFVEQTGVDALAVAVRTQWLTGPQCSTLFLWPD